MVSPSLSPRTSTTDRGSRIARLFPHFATRMTTSVIYNRSMYILSSIADIFKIATGSPGDFVTQIWLRFATKSSLAGASSSDAHPSPHLHYRPETEFRLFRRLTE